MGNIISDFIRDTRKYLGTVSSIGKKLKIDIGFKKSWNWIKREWNK